MLKKWLVVLGCCWVLLSPFETSPLFAAETSPNGEANSSSTTESRPESSAAKPALEPALYLRIPNPWELVLNPGYIPSNPQGSFSRAQLEQVRVGMSANVFEGLAQVVGYSWASSLLTQLDAPLEIFAFLDPDSPLPIPNVGIRTKLKCQTSELNDILQSLGESENRNVSLIDSLNASGKAVLSLMGQPIELSFVEGQLCLFGGITMKPGDLENFIELPLSFEAMALAESKVDTQGKGLFLWLQGKSCTTLLPQIQPALGMFMPMLGLDGLKSISLGWGKSDDLGRLRLFIETPRQGLLENLPITQSAFDLNARGEISQVFGLSLNFKDVYEKVEANLALFNPPLRNRLLEVNQKVKSKMNMDIPEILGFLGPELFVFCDDAGSFSGLRCAQPQQFKKLIAYMVEQGKAQLQIKTIGGREFYHLQLNTNAMLGLSLPLPKAFQFYGRIQEHLFYTFDGDYLVCASTPQDLMDRYLNFNKSSIATWLQQEQHQRVEHSLLFASTRTKNLPRSLHSMWIRSLLVLSDMAGAPLDVFALPTATSLNLPLYGRYGASLELPKDGLALELNFEHNPLEILAQSPGGLLGSVAAISVAAGLIMPNLAKAQRAAKGNIYMDEEEDDGGSDMEGDMDEEEDDDNSTMESNENIEQDQQDNSNIESELETTP
jgi:hypothetical protein